MFIIENDEFIKLIKSNTFIVLANQYQYTISSDIIYLYNFPAVEEILNGYNIFKSKDNIEIEKFKLNNIKDILSLISVNGKINVIKIGEFSKLEDFYENARFQNASMSYLLNKYSNANIISLTTLFLPKFSINSEEAIKALNDLKIDNLKNIKDLYKKHNITKDFDILVKEIKEECYLFKNNFKKGSSPFICDHVGTDTKYSEPIDFYWHVYEILSEEIESEINLNKLLKNKKNNKILEVLDEYNDLKCNLIRYDITFTTHVTKGPLQVVYYFNLNDDVKKYLLNFENDYLLTNLEDLAIYQNDILLYASCTHEGFRVDYSKN